MSSQHYHYRKAGAVLAAMLFVLIIGLVIAVYPASAGSNGQQIVVKTMGQYWLYRIEASGTNQSGQQVTYPTWQTTWLRQKYYKTVNLSNYWWVGRVDLMITVTSASGGRNIFECSVTVPRQSSNDWTTVSITDGTVQYWISNGTGSCWKSG